MFGCFIVLNAQSQNLSVIRLKETTVKLKRCPRWVWWTLGAVIVLNAMIFTLEHFFPGGPQPKTAAVTPAILLKAHGIDYKSGNQLVSAKVVTTSGSTRGFLFFGNGQISSDGPMPRLLLGIRVGSEVVFFEKKLDAVKIADIRPGPPFVTFGLERPDYTLWRHRVGHPLTDLWMDASGKDELRSKMDTRELVDFYVKSFQLHLSQSMFDSVFGGARS